MRKYEREYRETKTKAEFIRLALRRYKEIKRDTAIRRYYDLRVRLGTQTPKYESYQKQKPNHMKMIEFEDMKRLKYDINRKILRKYGFTEWEVNWLEDEENIKV